MDKTPAKSIDDFIARYPEEVQHVLNALREVIRQAAPGAEEAINYGIPTFRLHGNLVHFSAYARHIGFYPAPSGIETFTEELAPYAQSKGAVKFPLDQPLPYDLVRRIVEFRVSENLERARAKQSQKKKGTMHERQ